MGNLGVIESAMCVMSFMYKQAFPNEKPETFHDWVSNQFGERLFSIFFKTYTEKVWGMSCDEISADWAAQRIKGLDLWSGNGERAPQFCKAQKTSKTAPPPTTAKSSRP